MRVREERRGDGPALAPPACLRLAGALRELRERTGLSLVALGRRTAYSKSSWERYLNGKKPVPRKAVLALCALAEEPPGRLLALWELADAAWSGRSARPRDRASAAAGAAAGADGAAADGPGGSAHDTAHDPAEGAGAARSGRRWAVAGLVAAVVMAGGTVAGLAVADGGDASPRRAGSAAGPYEPRCVGAACEGKEPQPMGCGGPGQVTSVATRSFAPSRRVELRHGTACAAVWARAKGLLPGDRVELTVPGAAPKRLRAATAGDTRRYLATRMTALKGGAGGGVRGARVCVTLADGAGKECFSG
ncbi:helix-turn-helix domain-containing protein [Streptomyces sp. PmtG]